MRSHKILLGLVVAIVIAAAGVLVWSATCPCNRIPGFVLFGSTRDEPVTDWRFANDVPLCQIQVWTKWGPHSINLNCMATLDGQLFLSCSLGEQKFWCGQVKPNQPARLRLNGIVYPVLLNRVMDPVLLERAWVARVKKLQVYGGGPYNPKPQPDAKRPETWWSFQVRSEATS